MSFLSMMEAKLPPGFRFHPRDEELINNYLAKRITGEPSSCPMMVDVDLNKVEPWDLPDNACVGGKEWYFYSLRDRKYATGHRTNRATISGYWKATGKDRWVVDGGSGGKLVGMRKTLVFYQGRAPKGKKTDWVMHEFRMEGGVSSNHLKPPASSTSFKEDWVLCRVFYKSRNPSPKANTMENCHDDTGSSSLPPLMDAYINFEQPQAGNNLHAFNEQVPCFSNLGHNGIPFHHPPPPLPPPLNDTSLMQPQLGSLPEMGSYNMNTLSHACEKDIKAVLHSLIKPGGDRSMAAARMSLVESAESFLTEAGGHSMWNSF